MKHNNYRNTPVSFVVKQALAWLLIIVGFMGLVFGGFVHFLGAKDGLLWGGQMLSGLIAIPSEKAFHRAVYRKSIATLCVVVAILSVIGAFSLHIYFLIFGACLLPGLAILILILKPRDS